MTKAGVTKAAVLLAGVANAMALLFDPQTCGGQLAAVPVARAERLVTALRATGLPAAQIARVGGDGIRLRSGRDA